MLREELFDLILQATADAAGQIGEMQGVRRVVGDLKQAGLNAGVAVLQAQVEDGSLRRWKAPYRLALRYAKAHPERQPEFAGLG